MRFATAYVASLVTIVSALDLEVETKTVAKDDYFTPISMDFMAPPPNYSATSSTEDAASTTETQPAATEPESKTETDEKPATVTVDTDNILTPTTVNEQEEAPKSENGNFHPHGKDQQAPYDGYFQNS